MTDPAKRKPSPLVAVWRAMTTVAVRLRRHRDATDFAAVRLAQIEDRLAALDGGPSRNEASRRALIDLTVKRVEAGERPPCFRLGGDDNRLEWMDEERASQ